jgi:Na+/proline symporter
MLGLMLGGMIFATASSLNATLNISAGVFTNDLFKPLFPASTDKVLMRVARISTIVFGLLAVVVALLVQFMGGIVNVVISVAALTGVPLYLPVIWSLFSRRINGRTVLFTTLFSLAVNMLVKFAGSFVGLVLTRQNEMILGALFPIVILVVIELYFILRKKEDPTFLKYDREQIARQTLNDSNDNKQEVDSSNLYGKRVIGISVFSAGSLVFILGLIATSGKILVAGMGILLLLLGFLFYYKNKPSK